MKLFYISFLILSLLLCGTLHSQGVDSSASPKYIKVIEGYLMVLKQGDYLFEELEKLSLRENIPSATFTGMGFVNVDFGFFNAKKKTYKSRTFEGFELASLDGSIGWQNGKPSIHAHGVGGDKNYNARAGHILSLVVGSGSLEVLITVHEKRLERIKVEELGANVLELK